MCCPGGLRWAGQHRARRHCLRSHTPQFCPQSAIVHLLPSGEKSPGPIFISRVLPSLPSTSAAYMSRSARRMVICGMGVKRERGQCKECADPCNGRAWLIGCAELDGGNAAAAALQISQPALPQPTLLRQWMPARLRAAMRRAMVSLSRWSARWSQKTQGVPGWVRM